MRKLNETENTPKNNEENHISSYNNFNNFDSVIQEQYLSQEKS